MTVPLPPPNSAGIPLPSQPSDPPLISDISNAVNYLRDLEKTQDDAQGSLMATDEDIAYAHLFVHHLCKEHIYQGPNALVTVGKLQVLANNAVKIALKNFFNNTIDNALANDTSSNSINNAIDNAAATAVDNAFQGPATL